MKFKVEDHKYAGTPLKAFVNYYGKTYFKHLCQETFNNTCKLFITSPHTTWENAFLFSHRTQMQQ